MSAATLGWLIGLIMGGAFVGLLCAALSHDAKERRQEETLERIERECPR